MSQSSSNRDHVGDPDDSQVAAQTSDSDSARKKQRPGPEEPLERPGDEAIAQYLSSPKSLREFKSFEELGNRFGMTRMTVNRRSNRFEVLKRAEWLVGHKKLAGDVIVKMAWGRIVKAQVRKATRGDTRAARFCKDLTWPSDPNLQFFQF